MYYILFKKSEEISDFCKLNNLLFTGIFKLQKPVTLKPPTCLRRFLSGTKKDLNLIFLNNVLNNR